MFAKFKKWFIEFILITLAISGCTRSAPVNVSSLDNGEKSGKGFSLLPEGLLNKSAEVTPPGDYVQTITVEGETLEAAKTRSYALHVPASYDGSKAVSLVILLHSVDIKSGEFAPVTGFNTKSENNGFLVVYPDAFGDSPVWNPGFLPNSNGANDVAFISELIDHMLLNFNIEPKYVFVGGFFDGGMMAYQLGSAIPEKIAAIGAVGATIGYQNGENDIVMVQPGLVPVSVITIHGRLDETVPYEQTKRLKKGTPGFLPGVDAVHFWLDQNGCDMNPIVKQKKNENIVKMTFTCQNGTAVRSISIWNGNHSWPGYAVKSSAKKASMELDASAALWEFFVAHPRQ